ncbi:MAG TPA: methyltransferase domain-containing protein [Thermoanaerobaculia bacterium]|nr:methyltransferase domain-containing protein [Thermoanaerobaculia bacterium]
MDLEAAAAVLDREVRRLYKVPEGAPVEQLTEPLRTYVSYALECVLRGRLAMEEIRPFRALRGIRFLDAGCAYGGFLVAAAEAGAREVAGLDVDDRFLDVARPFLAASGIPHRLEKGDVSDAAVLGALGRFDLITCNDVIEHVDNVPRLVASLAAAVNEGGCLYVAAPNRSCPEFIRKDPHFQLFGITLLARAAARCYYAAWSGIDYYDVGEYFELDFHRSLLERQGLEVEVINVPPGPPREKVAELEAQFQELAATAAGWSDPRLPEDLAAEVRTAVAAAVKGFRDRRVRLAALEEIGDEAGAEAEAAGMVRDYAVAVWHLIARRPSSQGGYVTERPGLVRRMRRAVGRVVRG